MKERTKGKKMTIDKLAVMVAKGFDSIEKRMATKDDIKELKDDIKGIKNQLEGTNKRIDDVLLTRVKYEDHNKLKARVDVIEKTLK